MKKRDATDYLKDILNSIDEVETFIDDLTYDEFISDRKTLNAVVRSIEVIGEAAKNIPPSLRAKHKELPWKEMAGMRDKLIHGYFGIDTETIYKAAKTNIPQLKAPIQKMLKEQEKQ
ncbi:MAG: DUF86 domain-containing protein [Candidatus Bathyarchaeota archaeon]|nr:DUF86 domain-containing protein [Candidatus Bathyarchaeota archaeon]